MESRVRYSEVGRDRRLTMPALIDYLQDCATFQTEYLGVGIDYMAAAQKAWFLMSWNIAVFEYPRLGDGIQIQTWAADFGRLQSQRDFRVLGNDGVSIIKAHSEWVYMDLAAGRPIPVPEDEKKLYGYEAPVDIPQAPRHIKLPAEMENREPIRILKIHIDTNDHVNNCQYVRLALGLVPDGFPIRTLRVEYRRSAVLGDILYPRVAFSGSSYCIALEDEQGGSYAIMEFEGETDA